MTEVRDAVMRRWLTWDIHESCDQGLRLVLTLVFPILLFTVLFLFSQ